MEQFEIKTRIEFKPFLKLQYWLFYRRPVMLIFSIIGILVFMYGILILTNSEIDDSPIFPVVFGFVTLFLLPFSIWRNSKKSYNSNKNLQEEITYIFDNESIQVNGETFNSKVSINSIYKIKESKNWLLIYQSKNTFNIIPKSSLTNEQIAKIKELLK